jgi:D-alanine-D-alanine ligase
MLLIGSNSKRKNMIVGLTYNVRESNHLDTDKFGEFDSPETIAALKKTICDLGHDVVNIGNIKDLVSFLSQNISVNLVFNIAEGFYGRSRESQIPAVLEAFNIPYTFSDTLSLSLCLNKEVTQEILQTEGLPVPNFVVAHKEEYTFLDVARQFQWPLFVKPVHEGTSKGISSKSITQTENDLIKRVEWTWREYNQPAIIENYLAGREFTVGILGTEKKARVIGIVEITFVDKTTKVYGFEEKELCEKKVIYTPLSDSAIFSSLSTLALLAYKKFGVRDAGRIDIRLDADGIPKILEINPLAGLHPTHSDLPIIAKFEGMSYTELIKEIIESASERIVFL